MDVFVPSFQKKNNNMEKKPFNVCLFVHSFVEKYSIYNAVKNTGVIFPFHRALTKVTPITCINMLQNCCCTQTLFCAQFPLL